MPLVDINPNSDQTVQWQFSSPASHYTLVDEGFSRPTTTDYVYTTTGGNKEEYGYNFAAANNGQDIVSVMLRVYLGAAVGGSPYIRLEVTDGSLTHSSGNIIPPGGLFKEANFKWENNPFTALPWTWADLESGVYKFYAISIAGDGSGNVVIATDAIQIETDDGGSKYNGEKIGNS